MKLCPTCQRTYEDDALRFCLEDGTALVGAQGSAYDPAATIKIPAAQVTSDAPTEVIGEDQPAATRAARPAAQPTQRAERKYEPTPAPARKSSAAPWILGAAVVLGLSAIAVAFIMTRGNGASSTEVAQSNQNVSVNASPSESPSPSSSDENRPANIPGPVKGKVDYIPPPEATPTDGMPAATPSRTPVERPTPAASETTRPGPGGPISGGVLNGKAISLPKPPYPAIARSARASGTVTVQVTVDESGKVISARAITGHPLLQQAAVQAAYNAKFSPTQLSGQPVKVTGIITYNFVLD
jgi:TonB family protein